MLPGSQAQTPTIRARTAATAAAGYAAHWRRFVPKENLVAYFEFAGLDAHDAAWKNTASYKMLNDTTLGEMLGAVSEQLLEKVVSIIPDHGLSGSEIVTLVKHSARSGWVVALNADPKAPGGYRGTFVLRGGANKENRALTSRLMGWFMGAAKPKVDKKEAAATGRRAAAADAGATGGWVWWAEKNDLVVGFMDPSSADAIIATLDGKTPSAVEHEIHQRACASRRRRSSRFASDSPTRPKAAGSSSSAGDVLASPQDRHGAPTASDLRWGFEARRAAVGRDGWWPPSRARGRWRFSMGPTFKKTSLLPMPDQIDSFVETSISPRHLVDAIKQMAP